MSFDSDLVWGLFRMIMFIGTLVQTAFVVTYLQRPWRGSPVSRAVMHKSIAVCVMLWAMDHLWFTVRLPDEHLWLWVPLACWVTFTMSRQFWVLWRAEKYSHGPYMSDEAVEQIIRTHRRESGTMNDEEN